MSARAVVIDGGGIILRTVRAVPTDLVLQAGPGESLFAVVEDDGAYIDDAVVVVSETGELALIAGAPMGSTVPDLSIEYIAL